MKTVRYLKCLFTNTNYSVGLVLNGKNFSKKITKNQSFLLKMLDK